ncbi:perlustrin-like [Haliotis rufescens]|uniref:perlustrin-like n=1 Tax=Haliotis rufescens TaxID=6454 RepID=UPI00201FB009|nr:perlustrin-like [Haliotis rufescens]
MSRIFLMVVVILGMVFVDESNGLSCVPCEQDKCASPKCPVRQQIKDLCDCCDICGQRIGKPCSGFNQCVNGLLCIKIDGNEATSRLKLFWDDTFTGVCGILSTQSRNRG